VVTPAEGSPQEELPPRRVVLLGASNLVHGISTVVETAWNVWGRPLDVMAALGYGRSFGVPSRVYLRTLPGILHCRLWEDLAKRPAAPTAALITDIGNDLLYGPSVELITQWVELCLQRLSAVAEQILVSELPLESTSRVGRFKYLLMRSVLFPQSRLSYDEAMSRARQLNDNVKQLAARYNARVVRPRGHWYGFDPLHIKLRWWSEAWSETLAPWNESAAPARAKGSLRRWFRLRCLRQQRRRVLGFEQLCEQPAAKLADGTCISFY
jgi:hypothetical protein